MVTMLPDYIDPAIKSEAEKKLFREFRRFRTPSDIIILHSLGIANHDNKIFGEIDFVVICEEGILCIEVKGGHVSRENGKWRFRNRYNVVTEKTESPFQQVLGNTFSLRKYLINRLGNNDPIAKCQFASAVIMPDMSFTLEGADIIPDILFDLKFRWDLQSIIDKGFKYWRERLVVQRGYSGGDLEAAEIERAAVLLRGDFRLVPLMRSKIDQISKELTTMTDEQYDILTSLADNERLMIRGIAGSGKTLLAMEQARRTYWEGNKVLYLCFNSAIARYVKHLFEYEGVDLTVATIHALMKQECGINPDAITTPVFFSETLPDLFMALPEVDKYDVVIIDEAQDLLSMKYIPCIDRLIKGGISDGHWSLFYDTNQNIFQNNVELNECISALKRHAVLYGLSVNCRNTNQIVWANKAISNISTGGRSKANGDEPKYIKYLSKDKEFEQVQQTLMELSNEGVHGNEIVLLSRYKLDNPLNCLHGKSLRRPFKLKSYGDIWERKNDEVQFATIASFKGLESKVVLLIDVDKMEDSTSRLLHYVAVSRAKTNLFFFYNSQIEDVRQQMIKKAIIG